MLCPRIRAEHQRLKPTSRLIVADNRALLRIIMRRLPIAPGRLRLHLEAPVEETASIIREVAAEETAAEVEEIVPVVAAIVVVVAVMVRVMAAIKDTKRISS